ncbi:hypothetical protein B0H13DRAFT_2281371 [Mycena leptocephala]|nr:hypothetical protein B0H13DRAFT_2281371 [Mycena leptocephala]
MRLSATIALQSSGVAAQLRAIGGKFASEWLEKDVPQGWAEGAEWEEMDEYLGYDLVRSQFGKRELEIPNLGLDLREPRQVLVSACNNFGFRITHRLDDRTKAEKSYEGGNFAEQGKFVQDMARMPKFLKQADFLPDRQYELDNRVQRELEQIARNRSGIPDCGEQGQ